MAITEAYANTATIGTVEYSLTNNSTTLGSVATVGAYQIVLDLNAVIAGDQYELKLYEKCRSASTQRVVNTWIFTGAQGAPVFISESLILYHGWEVSMKKLTGTDRAIEWSIRRAA